MAPRSVGEYANTVRTKKSVAQNVRKHPQSYFEIPLDDIDYDDKTYCFRASLNLKSLIEDINKNDQDFPVVLRNNGNDKKYQLVCGFRRIGALLNLNRKNAKAIVLDLSDDDALRLAWSENESRRSYSPIDRAIAICKAHRSGKTIEELQEIFNLKKRQLIRLKKVAMMPNVLSSALSNQTIGITHAIILHQASERNVGVNLEYWIDEIEQQGLTVRQLKYRLNRQHKKKNREIIEENNGIIKLRSTKIRVQDLSFSEREKLMLLGRRLIEIASA